MYPEMKIKVGENGHYTDEKKKKIESYKNTKYYELPFDSGVCVGRNTLIKKVRTKYVLVGDDDFLYNEDAKVQEMIEFLEANPEYDLIGGRIFQNNKVCDYQGFFEFKDKSLTIKPLNVDEHEYKVCESSKLRYADCDLTFNFFVARVNSVKDVLWDEKIKVAYEHASFFIAMKQAGKKVAFSPDPVVIHKPKLEERIDTVTYSKYRLRRTDMKRFFQKHNITTLTDMKGNTVQAPESMKLEYNMKGKGEITFVIKTLKRPDSLEKLLFSIVEFYPHSKILIGDDDFKFDTDYYQALWQRLFDAGMKTKPTAFNIKPDAGLSYSRNFLMKHVQTEYALLLDDDFIFTKETKIENFKKILEDNEDIGVVGGKLIQGKSEMKFAGHFEINGDTLHYKKLSSEKNEIDGLEYYLCDFVLNFGLFRKEMFDDVQWDDDLKIAGEHTDFYLKNRFTNWLVAYTPSVTALHEPTSSPEYKQLRARNEFTKKMFRKWNLKHAIYEETRYKLTLKDDNTITNTRI